jgi:hypothetical protein
MENYKEGEVVASHEFQSQAFDFFNPRRTVMPLHSLHIIAQVRKKTGANLNAYSSECKSFVVLNTHVGFRGLAIFFHS